MFPGYKRFLAAFIPSTPPLGIRSVCLIACCPAGLIGFSRLPVSRPEKASQQFPTRYPPGKPAAFRHSPS